MTKKWNKKRKMELFICQKMIWKNFIFDKYINIEDEIKRL